MKKFTIPEMDYILNLKEALKNVKANELVTNAEEQYKFFARGKFVPADFQKKVLRKLLKNTKNEWTGEFPTGSGKTIIQAFYAAQMVAKGPVIYICPNRTALGNESEGILQKFFSILSNKFKRRPLLGKINEATITKDVLFFTPGSFLGIQKRDEKLFNLIAKNASCVVVDESHHFPTTSELKVYGRLTGVLKEAFKNKPRLKFTATHYRLDGAGLSELTERLTYQELCSAGRLPEIFCIAVFLKIACPDSTMSGNAYSLNLKGKQNKKYLKAISDCIFHVHKERPKPFAGFFHLVKDAEAVAKALNKVLDKPVHVLSYKTSKVEREAIRDKIINGESWGYLTCGVGAESLDIPCIEVIHLVRRTRSMGYVVQALGRGTRQFKTKKNCLVVDYHVHEKKILRAAVGFDYVAKVLGSTSKDGVRNGGGVVTQKPSNIFQGLHIAEQKKLVIGLNTEQFKEEMIALAKSGAPRPICARLSTHLSADPQFKTAIVAANVEWIRTLAFAKFKEKMLTLAKSGAPKPTSQRLSDCICTDPKFRTAMAIANIEWMPKLAVAKFKEEMLALAKSGAPKPNSARLRNHLKHDREFRAEIIEANVEWCLLAAVAKFKEEMIALAKSGAPRPRGKAAVRLGLFLHTDPQFRAVVVAEADIEWFPTIAFTKFKEEMLALAKSGAPRPKELRLTTALSIDPQFRAAVIEANIAWLPQLASRLTRSKFKEEMIALAKSGEPKPNSAQLRLFTARDPEFRAALRQANAKWASRTTAKIS